MPTIHVLDAHTAELIAAGEVVERPASVVKELTENAIDAGAKAVTVSIERGGTMMIQIADDGCGIEAESIPTAFIRHATSKIAQADDLESIQTLGFRGEALASVASVAHVELLTKTEADEYAYLYRISGGAEEGIEPAARPVGTTITVRDLFYNTPARMKFLKKDTTEGNYAADVVMQLALSHPEISFRFVRDGKPQFQTPGDGNLRGAAYAVLSREFAKDLLPVQSAVGSYTVHGLITPQRQARASRTMQFFFINGRYVKNRTMMAALEAAYKGTLMQGKFPGCVLFLTMPPQLVDVNVHPAKTEVRFAREKDVFDAVYQSVKNALSAPESAERTLSFGAFAAGGRNIQGDAEPRAYGAGETDVPLPGAARGGLSAEESAARPVFAAPNAGETDACAAEAERGGVSQAEHSGILQAERDVSEAAQRTFAAPQRAFWQPSGGMLASAPAVSYLTRERLDIWPEPEQAAPTADAQRPAAIAEAVPETISKTAQQVAQAGCAPCQTILAPLEKAVQSRPMRLIGEVFDTYIVAQRGEDLCLLDKHAAHERILYEKLAASYGNVSSQLLLTPVTVQLSAEEKDAMLQSQTTLQESGLEIEDFGGSSIVVRAVPADVAPRDVEDLAVELADRLAKNPRDTVSEKTQWVLHSIACRAAVKAGDQTPNAQLLRLAEDVLDGKIPPFCPHGRPVVLKIPKKELEKQFGRQG